MTLQATDLRIGNLVHPVINGYVLEHIPHKVECATLMLIAGQISNKNEQNGTTTSFAPIPLSEDWLKRLGLELSETGNYFKMIKCPINEDSTFVVFPPKNLYNDKRENDLGYGVRLQSYILDSVTLGIIRYVHQLQNIYYAVAQTELQLS